eukprot:TRINITY_DN6002_c0_g1_i1.p1 TRINITY_DN6002_c0_g1~~TRINITY_DN6002_c0_g1_i1.p1  ORF type:complete len:154 (+),score=15.85 TRINITY_DN6002_c0_g1_i1:106-567(+)
MAIVSDKRTLYVGGLSEEVDEDILADAFLPFGDVVLPVNMPRQDTTGEHRGFAFVEMDCQEDAAAAIENMNGAELYGRVLKVWRRPRVRNVARRRGHRQHHPTQLKQTTGEPCPPRRGAAGEEQSRVGPAARRAGRGMKRAVFCESGALVPPN